MIATVASDAGLEPTAIQRILPHHLDLPAWHRVLSSLGIARERLFTAAALRHGTPVSIVRLNYAVDLRYGVLVDIASRVLRGGSWRDGPRHCRAAHRGWSAPGGW